MDNQPNVINWGRELFSWQVLEHEKYERTKRWYIIAGSLAVLLVIYAMQTNNLLFAFIIIIAALIMILLDGREPEVVSVIITTNGIVIGNKFYDYDELKDFSIIYKPNYSIKKLYFEFKSSLKPRLSIFLDNLNPLLIRESLLKYLPEDLERIDQPASENIARLLKI